MATCLAAVILLLITMNGTPHSLLIVTVALALFGAGEGLFAAPNNSSIMGAAPPERTGEAGSVLNVMRNFGTGLGIAAASSLLAWRLAARTGHAAPTTLAAPGALLSASHDVLLLLAAFAAAACAISLIRPHHQLAGGVQHSVG
jgi:MFS family permease